MTNKPYYEGTRQYIGARYVPKFADPVQWSDQMVYEPMTIVTYMNSSYTSRKEVPAGTLPTNNEYWALTGNYNAAIGDIQTEMDHLSDEFDGLETKVNAGLTAANDAIAINTNAISTINTDLTALETTVNSIAPKADDLFNLFNNKRIVICGDSISSTTLDDPAISTTWSVRFANAMRKYNASVTNYAVPGARFYPEDNNSISNQILNISPSTYDILIIMGGVNDFYNNTQLGSPFQTDVSSFWQTLLKIGNHLTGSRTAVNPPKVYMITPLSVTNTTPNEVGLSLDCYRIALGSFANYYNLTLINGNKVPSWNPVEGTTDGTHPKSETTHIIADYIIRKMISGGDAGVEIEGFGYSIFASNQTGFNHTEIVSLVQANGFVSLLFNIIPNSVNPHTLTYTGLSPYVPYDIFVQRVQDYENNEAEWVVKITHNYNSFTVEATPIGSVTENRPIRFYWDGWCNALTYPKWTWPSN